MALLLGGVDDLPVSGLARLRLGLLRLRLMAFNLSASDGHDLGRVVLVKLDGTTMVVALGNTPTKRCPSPSKARKPLVSEFQVRSLVLHVGEV